METMPKFEGGTTTYNREAVAEAAMEQADTMLEEKIPGLQEMPAEQRIEKLDNLIKELSVTIEGTTIPVHNEHRHVVDQLSLLLSTEIAQAEFNARMKSLQVKT